MPRRAPHLLPPDPLHARALPSGIELAREVRKWRRKQMRAVIASLNRGGGVPSLESWVQPMSDALYPVMERYYLHGAQEAMKRIARAEDERAERDLPAAHAGAGKRVRAGVLDRHAVLVHAGGTGTGRTDLRHVKGIWNAFTVFRQSVVSAVRNLTMVFCRTTLNTAKVEAEEAVAETRRQLEEGLSQGEAHQQLSRRVREIFDDPEKALTISQTEGSRAMHAGEADYSRQSGATVGSRWLASSDACPLCLAINGKVVGHGEPFVVLPKGGPYATVFYPPYHPRCQCTTVPVFEWDVTVQQ